MLRRVGRAVDSATLDRLSKGAYDGLEIDLKKRRNRRLLPILLLIGSGTLLIYAAMRIALYFASERVPLQGLAG